MKYLISVTSFLLVLAAHPVLAQEYQQIPNPPVTVLSTKQTCLNNASTQRQIDKSNGVPKSVYDAKWVKAVKSCR
jgi:hypothetical protein